jgi:hypothetical protein
MLPARCTVLSKVAEADEKSTAAAAELLPLTSLASGAKALGIMRARTLAKNLTLVLLVDMQMMVIQSHAAHQSGDLASAEPTLNGDCALSREFERTNSEGNERRERRKRKARR